MPGAQTHLFAGREFLRSDQKVVAEENFGYFLMGTIFPDFGYWPGKDQQISDLAHYVGSSTLPKLIYDNAETDAWKAFALGWLLHVHMDINGHHFINRLAGEHKGSEEELTYLEDMALHAKVEFGLDLALTCKFGKLRIDNLKLPHLAENPLSTAYKLCYGIELGKDKIEGFCNVSKMIDWFYHLQSFLTRNKRIGLFAKSLVNKFAPEKSDLIDSFLSPEKHSDKILEDYLQITYNAISLVLKDGKPNWSEENYNLDTGRISKLGEYKLADKMFKIVDKTMNPQNIQNRYPSEADEILNNWEKIKSRFM